ncbi:protein kinase family protein [Chengkuizengella marina]|uniref:Protein kinase family protein n=1 Tax=Chengkuizengella marina TaxID=2507566 RepID=A0A6N9Q878_9BACL|nr:protein kinase family protein [Chengkuizengella marina]NBI30824.1 protein kinase family protein [Chengkuizengella marina]
MTTSYKSTNTTVLHEGFKIQGKWNKKNYEIQRLLGEGTSGKVYLVNYNQNVFAMKIGLDEISLQSEINVIKKINKKLEPDKKIFIDSDDFELNGKIYSFYIMKYIQGLDAKLFLNSNGQQWFHLVGLNILNQLQKLHQMNFIFGDLKIENVIVSEFGKVTLIDYGGVTPKGRSIKQFTEIYDRGYWINGTRKADEAYDIFSFAILCLILTGALSISNLTSEKRSGSYLLKRAKTNPHCKRMIPFLEKALNGTFSSTRCAREEWKKLMYGNGFENSNSIELPWLKPALASSIFVLVVTVYFSFIY